MAFRVLNSSGQRKLAVTSDILAIPLTYTQGGTGLTGYAAGDLPYGASGSSFGRIPIKIDSKGVMEFLCNNGTIIFTEPSQTPIWTPMAGIFPAYARVGDMLSGLNKSAFVSTKIANTTSFSSVGADTISVSSSSASVTRITDTSSSWIRAISGSTSGNSITIGGNGLWQSQHTTYLEVKLRTGPDITNTRFFFGIINTSFSNADDQSTVKGYGFRYSTAAGDSSFVPWYANGTAGSQFIGGPIGSIAPSTIYTIGIGTAGEQCYLSINGTFVTFLIPSITSVNLALVGNIWTLATANKQLDISSISYEWN